MGGGEEGDWICCSVPGPTGDDQGLTSQCHSAHLDVLLLAQEGNLWILSAQSLGMWPWEMSLKANEPFCLALVWHRKAGGDVYGINPYQNRTLGTKHLNLPPFLPHSDALT